MQDMLIPPGLVFVAALTTCLASLWAQGQTPGPSPSEPSWVRGGAYRLKTSVFRGAQTGAEPVLVVVLHGDAPFNRPGYQNTFAAQVAATHRDVVGVGLLRPGYTDPQGNTSDGERGLSTGDNWNATNTDAIDEGFANSPWETKTDTEREFAASWVKQMGNIEFLLLSIGGVVFFTLLLVTGNTMAIAVRERIRDLAVLKAVGFSDGFVLALILAETTMLAAVGGGVGLALAKLFTLRGDPTGGLLPFFYLPPKTMALGVALAMVVGLMAGLLPALAAMRLRVVDALRKV